MGASGGAVAISSSSWPQAAIPRSTNAAAASRALALALVGCESRCCTCVRSAAQWSASAGPLSSSAAAQDNSVRYGCFFIAVLPPAGSVGVGTDCIDGDGRAAPGIPRQCRRPARIRLRIALHNDPVLICVKHTAAQNLLSAGTGCRLTDVCTRAGLVDADPFPGSQPGRAGCAGVALIALVALLTL